MGSRHCLGRLDAYLEGALPPAAGRRVEHHLASCPDCARVARERARVLVAARSVVSRPAAVPPPVMRPRGMSGRVVVGVLTFAVLLGGLLAAVWMAGAPRTTAARSPSAPTDAVGLVQGDGSGQQAAAGLIEELRAHGWAVPSLAAAGLRPLQVRSTERGDTVTVTVDWGADATQATVHECRSRTRTAPPASCVETGDVDAPASADGARLPGGTAYRISPADAGGAWEAAYRTSQAAYRVTSVLPRERAEPLLTQLVVSEKSGLTELRHEEQIRDRIERGLERFSEVLPTGALAGVEAGPGGPHPAAGRR